MSNLFYLQKVEDLDFGYHKSLFSLVEEKKCQKTHFLITQKIGVELNVSLKINNLLR